MRRLIFVCLFFLPSLLSADSSADPYSRPGMEMVYDPAFDSRYESPEGTPHDLRPTVRKLVISGDGSYIAYLADFPSLHSLSHSELFIYDRQNHTKTLLRSFGCCSGDLSISGNGRLIAFEYGEKIGLQFVGDDPDYLKTVTADGFTTVRADVTADASLPSNELPNRNPSLSADGRYVAFESYFPNPDDASGFPRRGYIYVGDLVQHATERVSTGFDGGEPDGNSERPSISGDGLYVAFASEADNLVSGAGGSDYKEIFFHDRQTHTTERVSVGRNGEGPNGDSSEPAISTNGLFVAFQSNASNLVEGDTNDFTDIFVYDRYGHTTQRIDCPCDSCRHPDIDEGGWLVVFECRRNPYGTYGTGRVDIRAHSLRNHSTTQISLGEFNRVLPDFASHPSISDNAQFVAFRSLASLVSGDTDRGEEDIYVASVITTHLECRNNACTPVSGPPQSDLCTQGRNDCGEQPAATKKPVIIKPPKKPHPLKSYHLECRGNACVPVKGTGYNKCKKNLDCT